MMNPVKLISAVFFLFVSSSLVFPQDLPTIRTQISGGIEEAIRLRMLPFYGFYGDWDVAVKEIGERGDTTVFYGKALCSVRQDSARIKRDSSEINFLFKWDSDVTRDFMDIHSLSAGYSWDIEKYVIKVEHEYRDQNWRQTNCFPAFDLGRNELYYAAGINEDPAQSIVLSQWKLSDNKIIILHREQRMDPKKFRDRVIIFQRNDN